MEISKELFDIMKDACDDNEVKLHTDYSGRDMYGKTCVAMSGERPDIMRALRSITEDTYDISEALDDENEGAGIKLRNEWMEMAFQYSEDQLGLGIIIYWPHVAAPAE